MKINKEDKDEIVSRVTAEVLKGVKQLLAENKEEVIEAAVEAMTKTLTVPITMERYKSMDGKLTSGPVVDHKEVFLPSFFVETLYHYEGRVRGIQEEVFHLRNRVAYSQEILDKLGMSQGAIQNILLKISEPITKIAEMKKEITHEETLGKTE